MKLAAKNLGERRKGFMDNELKKKYGLPTAIALVIGIVIGSGVFFKAEKILTATGGNLPLASSPGRSAA